MPHYAAERKFAVLMLGFALCLLLPEGAFAAGASSPMGDVLCDVIGLIYGNLGRGLATLAVIFLGVGATLGKVSWGLSLMTATGIGVIFSAPFIVNNFLTAMTDTTGAGPGLGIGCVMSNGWVF